MKMNKMIALGTVVASGYAATNATADMVMYTDNFGPQTTPFSQQLMFTKFNTGLGTLTGITIQLDTHEVASVEIENITGSPQSFTDATATIPLTVTGLGGVTTSLNGSATVASGTAGLGLTVISGVTASQTGSLNVPSSSWASYEGSGTGDYTLTVNGAMGSYTGVGPFGVFFGGTAMAQGDVIVTYDYTPSPVPDSAVTVSLLGGIFGMIGVSRKLRTAKI